MKNNIIQSEMDVKGSKINVVRVNGYEYISLTDLAKTQNDEAPADVVKNWLRNKETISFLGVWEELNNENFKVVEFDQFKNEAGRHAFTMPLKNGLEKQMLLVLFQNLVNMVAELLQEVILLLSLLVGLVQSLNYI